MLCFFALSSAPHEPILGVTAPLIGCRRILMICIGLSNAFAINLIMFHQISGVFIMKDKISKFWSVSVPRCGSLVVGALGTLPGRSLVRSRAWLFCKKTSIIHGIFFLCAVWARPRLGGRFKRIQIAARICLLLFRITIRYTYLVYQYGRYKSVASGTYFFTNQSEMAFRP